MRSDLITGFERQIAHCLANDAPITARICRAAIAVAHGTSRTGARMADWPRDAIEDALPLRYAGGLHHLFLTGRADDLGAVYAGQHVDQAMIDAICDRLTHAHDDELYDWLDSPPQTNEAGRSANFMAAMMWLSPRIGPRFDLYEIGASAGINLMLNRFRFDLGGVMIGPRDSPIVIAPAWRGSAPIAAPVDIVATRGCDRQPVDLTDADHAARLRAYIWPEAKHRFARMEAAIAMAHDEPPAVDHADAADWVAQQFARAPVPGATRVLMHSIVWQYLPAPTQTRIDAIMADAARRATPEQPLAWISVETNRNVMRHELRVRYWAGGAGKDEDAVLGDVILGHAQAHGSWIDWQPQDR